MTSKVVLVATCPDVAGIVRSLTDFIYRAGGNIAMLDQFSDLENSQFFTRIEFVGTGAGLPPLSGLQLTFAPIAEGLNMQWDMFDADVMPRVLVAVSKFGHCLNDLLFRWADNDLPADIVAVVSNHEDYRRKVEWYGIPYHYLPVDNHNRAQQEAGLMEIIRTENVDLLVLARYMQILSKDMCERLTGRAINIHHSFLPGFKGASPYRQAYERGVKLIGATAHYVTEDLDEGPIIEQSVHRVRHSDTPRSLTKLGRDIESQVLSRAVTWHCEHRVLLNGSKTIVFS
jgi:formyltetrahydrofolate deformylase